MPLARRTLQIQISNSPFALRVERSPHAMRKPSIIARVLRGAGYAFLPFIPLGQAEGVERQTAFLFQFTPCGVHAQGSVSPAGAPPRLLRPRAALSSEALPRYQPSSWQGIIVSPGGAPEPPGVQVCET